MGSTAAMGGECPGESALTVGLFVFGCVLVVAAAVRRGKEVAEQELADCRCWPSCPHDEVLGPALLSPLRAPPSYLLSEQRPLPVIIMPAVLAASGRVGAASYSVRS